MKEATSGNRRRDNRRLILLLCLLGAVLALLIGKLGQLMLVAPGREPPPR